MRSVVTVVVVLLVTGIASVSAARPVEELAGAAPDLKAQSKGTITANVTSLSKDGQNVAVSWTLPAGFVPTKTDNIAVYLAPIASTFKTMSTIKYKLTDGNATGTVTFRLINLRQDYQFGYVRNNTLAFFGAPLVNNIVNQPTMVHLNPGPNPTVVTVQWATKNVTSPVVKWGTSPAALTRTAGATSGGYTKQKILDACGWGTVTPPANAEMTSVGLGWIDPGTIHLATLKGLKYNTTYYYQVTANNPPPHTHVTSPTHSFTTAPAPGSNQTLTILYAADMGVVEADGSLRAKNHNNKAVGALAVLTGMGDRARTLKGPRLAMANGDISYSDGVLVDWQNYFDEARHVVASMPTISTQGNHERDYFYNKTYNSGDVHGFSKFGGECGVPYEALFAMPNTSHTKQYWSMDYGPVHFLQLDSELDMGNTSAQYKFAAADLAAVNRTTTPFVIANWHRLMYCPVFPSDFDCLFGDALMEKGWDDLVYKHNVTLVLNGHTHVYARTCPVYNRECRGPNVVDGSVPITAPIHVTSGWGGPTGWKDLTNASYPNDAYFPVKSGKDQFGFLELKVNRTHLSLEAIPVDANGVPGEGTFKPLAPIDTLLIPAPVF